MSSELDPKIAERIARNAIGTLWPSQNVAVVCTRRALKEAFLSVIQEAYEMGLLAGEEVCVNVSTLPGGADRPAWTDIRIDAVAELAAHRIRFKPIVVRSLIGAGYRCLGDLRWA